MKFLVDAQLPSGLVPWLTQRGHEAEFAPYVMAAEASDDQIAAYAADQGMIIVTKE